MVRIDRLDVFLGESLLGARHFFAPLGPTGGEARQREHRDEDGGELRTRDKLAEPFGDHRREGFGRGMWGGFALVDARPNGGMKSRRQGGVRAPLLEQLREVILAGIFGRGLHNKILSSFKYTPGPAETLKIFGRGWTFARETGFVVGVA